MASHALLVGLNAYANSQFNLRGCLNDIDSLAGLLVQGYGFDPARIDLLRDGAATAQTIMSRLDSMLAGAKSGDTLVFAFSGHGTQIASKVPGENDLKDECLVPYEGTYNSLIKDDDLYALFNKYVDPHLKFTAIYDCCHSGTMLRSLGLDEEGRIIEETINRHLEIEQIAALRTKTYAVGPYNVLSACRDEETAADVRAAGAEGLPRGAFSYALHDFLKRGKDTPVALADPQVAAGIRSVTSHVQNPHYVLIDQGSPLIRY